MPTGNRTRSEPIIERFREAELEIAKGHTAFQATEKIGVTQPMDCRCGRKNNGLQTWPVKRFKRRCHKICGRIML